MECGGHLLQQPSSVFTVIVVLSQFLGLPNFLWLTTIISLFCRWGLGSALSGSSPLTWPHGWPYREQSISLRFLQTHKPLYHDKVAVLRCLVSTNIELVLFCFVNKILNHSEHFHQRKWFGTWKVGFKRKLENSATWIGNCNDIKIGRVLCYSCNATTNSVMVRWTLFVVFPIKSTTQLYGTSLRLDWHKTGLTLAGFKWTHQGLTSHLRLISGFAGCQLVFAVLPLVHPWSHNW